jgi:hypothetical protein
VISVSFHDYRGVKGSGFVAWDSVYNSFADRYREDAESPTWYTDQRMGIAFFDVGEVGKEIGQISLFKFRDSG